MPRALVTGVTGQDGWYLSELLLAQGADVFGLVAEADPAPLPMNVTPVAGDMADEASLRDALEATLPDEIYNLAGVSSVAESWRDPVRVGDINGLGVARLLRAARDMAQSRGLEPRVVQASSAEIFAGSPSPHTEQTPIRPTTPYGAAKAYAHHSVGVYRLAGMHASSAILYNHESPRRPPHFVTRKITRGVARIARGSREPLILGNLDARRDWGFAGDYMRALMLMAQQESPADFIIASGVARSVREFVSAAFACVGIEDWSSHVQVDAAFVRPVDAPDQYGDPAQAAHTLGWRPMLSFADLVAEMVEADLADVDRMPRDS
ncbi:MAG: GDP-mannose 4,6-dehydratase [Actinomycetota bacterium]|nr:GDP-mannose 4,6-dehydratase [Actinomycetota bacterium]